LREEKNEKPVEETDIIIMCFFFESLPNVFDIGANFMLVLCRQNVIGGNKLVKMAIAAVIRNGF